MKRYAYKKADAFTGGASRGNPAAFMVIPEELTHEDYLAFGKEHAGFVSEVVFCLPSAKHACKLVYYSSQCEVDFCGHGTIATMYEIIKNDSELRKKSEITVETNRKGVITIYNSIDSEDAIYITAPAAQYLNVPVSSREAADALSIDAALIAADAPIDFIDAGLRTLTVPISDFKTEVSVYPNEAALKEFCLKNGIDIILIFSKRASADGFIAHTRVFAPKFGYLEDPATGSGNSAFGNYMLKNKLWRGEPVCIEQGGDNIRYNTVRLKTKDGAVLFGGRASLRIEGEYIYE